MSSEKNPKPPAWCDHVESFVGDGKTIILTFGTKDGKKVNIHTRLAIPVGVAKKLHNELEFNIERASHPGGYFAPHEGHDANESST